MKKSVLILLTLIPIIVGYLVNVLIMVPVIGMAGFCLLPLLKQPFGFIWANSMHVDGNLFLQY